MFNPKHLTAGEKAQKVFFEVLKTFKLLVFKLLKSLAKILNKAKHQHKQVEGQSMTSAKNHNLEDKKRFDKIFIDRLSKKGVLQAAEKVKKFKAGQTMLLTVTDAEKLNEALIETRKYIADNPQPKRQAKNQASPPQNRQIPPSPSLNTDFVETNQKAEPKKDDNVILESLGYSEQASHKASSKLQEGQTQTESQSQSQTETQTESQTNPETIIIIISDRLEKANASSQIKDFFNNLGNAIKQGAKTFKDSLTNQRQRNFKKDLNNLSVALASSRLLDMLGSVQENGKKVFENESYKISANPHNSRENLQVIDKSKGLMILSNNGKEQGRLVGNVTNQNAQDFLNLNKQLNLAILETGKQLEQKQIPSSSQRNESKTKTSQIER